MFALKPNKNKDNKKGGKSNKNFTLDTKHREMIDKFKKDSVNLPQYKIDLKTAEEQHDVFKNKSKSEMSYEDFNRLKDIKDNIRKLKKKIKNIESKKDYNKYILRSSDILFSYYQSQDNVEDSNIEDSNSDEGQQNVNSVENIFTYLVTNGGDKSKSESKDDSLENKDDDGDGDGDADNESKNTNKNTNKSKRRKGYTSNRASLLNKFMVLNDKNYVQSKTKKRVSDKCSNCNEEVMILQTEGKIVCEHCGVEEDVIINSDKPSFRDPPSELTYFAYKRINHFNETLAQIQAKESTEIPEKIFDDIKNELKRERVTNMKKLNKKMIKKYLNRLGYNKYYEHAPYIIQKLSGKQLNIPRELEEQAKLMFRMAEEQFPKIKPADRKNFLNYNYMHYKIFEMLGYHDIKKNFPLLKGKPKLHLQDQMLHDIAEILKKKFPPGNVWFNFRYTDDF